MSSSISRDVVTFALDAQTDYDSAKPLFVNAHNSSQFLTAAQFEQLVRTLIAGFAAQGIKRGDVVLLHTGNNVLYTAFFLSIIGSGGIYMGSNPQSQPDELAHIVQLVKPRFIITEDEPLSTVVKVSEHNNIPVRHIFVLNEAVFTATIKFAQEGALSSLPSKEPAPFLSLLSHGCADPIAMDDQTAKSTPAALYSTSGTTGLPKAAVLTHANLIAQHESIFYPVPYEVIRLNCLPSFHLFSSLWAHLFPIRYGHPIYIMRGFQIPAFLDVVQKYQISETYLVPAMVHMLNQTASTKDIVPKLESLRYVGIAGAPIDGASMELFHKSLHPNACAGQIWGMTECGVVFQHRFSDKERGQTQGHLGSIGVVAPAWQVRILANPTGSSNVNMRERKCERGILAEEATLPGQLHVRGAGVFSGYLGLDHDTVDEEGWFDTGDVAYCNATGEYFIVGRTKELIKVLGYQVSPAEIEAVLLKHSDIMDVAVTGMNLPDRSTEVPCAYVVRTGCSKISSEEVYNFAQQRLASYKAIDGGVFFVDKIPRTASGKIQRGKLAGMNQKREALAGLLNANLCGNNLPLR